MTQLMIDIGWLLLCSVAPATAHEMTIEDSDGNVLMEINDEEDAGS